MFSIFILFLIATVLVAQDWQELKGEHFIVYFTQDKEEEFVKGVLRKAERDYVRIATDLGYARYEDFWTWDSRVKIYIYPDHASYLKYSNQPDWSEGMADYVAKSILSYSGSQNFLISILPHEMAHLIFRDFVGFKGEIPLWLDEGVAQWEEEVSRYRIKSRIREFLDKKSLLSLNDMMKLDIRLIEGTHKLHLCSTSMDGKPGFLILDGNNLVDLYYLQAASLVGFLIEQYGANRFTELCRQLRDGKDLEDALRFAYPTKLRSIDELEDKWLQYLREE